MRPFSIIVGPFIIKLRERISLLERTHRSTCLRSRIQLWGDYKARWLGLRRKDHLDGGVDAQDFLEDLSTGEDSQGHTPTLENLV